MLDTEKQNLRKRARLARLRLHAEQQQSAAVALREQGLPIEWGRPGILAAFHPLPNEINLLPLAERLAGEGWTLVLPVVVAKEAPLVFRRWKPGDPLFEAGMGVQIPCEAAGQLDPDILLVPLLAFDVAGYRLGYGGGFYDRTLASLRAKKPILAIGVGYSGQEVDHVPHGPHDARLDGLLTEKGYRPCG